MTHPTDPIRALCAEMADQLELDRRCLLDDITATHPLVDRARALLSQPPEPAEGPVPVDALAMPACVQALPEQQRRWYSLGWNAALSRYGTPRPAPIAVAERLPGPGDCAPWPDDSCSAAVPWCWAAKEVDGGWEWTQLSMLGLGTDTLGRIIAGGGWTHWLPWWALPLPAPPIAAELGEAQP